MGYLHRARRRHTIGSLYLDGPVRTPDIQDLPAPDTECESHQAGLLQEKELVWEGHECGRRGQFQVVSYSGWKDSWVGLVTLEEGAQ